MSQTESEDRKIFEEKLDKALDEAWSKVNDAFDQSTGRTEQQEMSIRLAAEAVEYSSALFSLTYGLEDLDPQVKVGKNQDLVVLVKDSLEALRRARELRGQSAPEAYASLRKAADYLKTAYLDQVKKTSAKRS